MPVTKIEHAFQIADQVYLVDSKYDAVRKPCDACLGEAILRIRQKADARVRRRKCPFCYGKGTRPDGEQNTAYLRGRFTISGVDIRTEREFDYETEQTRVDTRIHYTLTDDDGRTERSGVDARDLFTTRDEARAEIKKRNDKRVAPPTVEVA